MKISHLRVITLAELKRVWNDKRFVLLIVFAPIIICIALGFIAYKTPDLISTTIFVDSPQQTPVDKQIQQIITDIANYKRDDGSQPFVVTIEPNSLGHAMQRLEEGTTRAIIILKQGENRLEGVEAIVDATEPSVLAPFQQELPRILSGYSADISVKLLTEFLTEQKVPPQTASQMAGQALSPFEATFNTNAWKEMKFFDVYASAVIILIALCLPLFLILSTLPAELSG